MGAVLLAPLCSWTKLVYFTKVYRAISGELSSVTQRELITDFVALGIESHLQK